ncbi:MAG: ABC transporter ATP-binding protein [Coriobacteriia bacterium]|nr:ABC transporter ATP-binding protein [Coriobacteriia bacterium]
MTLLSIQGLRKQFGGLLAVDDVSFGVHEGTIKALIGPNGAGKSTLFNLITGFERPDSGAALLNGVATTGMSARDVVRCGMARTFQDTRLFDNLTVIENVMVGTQVHYTPGFFAAALRLPSARKEERMIQEQAIRLLRQVGLEEWAGTPASELPVGIRRLTEIARAMATEPTLLLLDEPAAGLNSSETEDLGEALSRMRDLGTTVLVVEHDMALVMEVSDEIVVIDRGRKIAEGPPRLIQKDPVVVAAYLGEEYGNA